jgi:hypothetical protein
MIASTRLKMAAFAPMPSASVKIAVAANPGFLTNCRNANRVSRKRLSNHATLFPIEVLSFALVEMPNAILAHLCAYFGLSPSLQSSAWACSSR